jgi:hypothetical protein
MPLSTSPRIPEPGDPTFDWSNYDSYAANKPDPVADAHKFLDQSYAEFPETPSLASKIRTAHPNAYDDVPDDVLEKAHARQQFEAQNNAPYSPGLADSEHPALATVKGFLSGAATGLPTAARIAQVALPVVTGGTSIPVQMAIGAGAQGLADLADRAAGDPSAPQTATGALAHAATGAIVPGGVGGARLAVDAVKPLAAKVASGGVPGAMLGGYLGYRHGGVLGALEGAALGGAGGSALGKLGRLGRILTALNGENGGPSNQLRLPFSTAAEGMSGPSSVSIDPTLIERLRAATRALQLR